jgi:vancomycin permeability regulator SanA
MSTDLQDYRDINYFERREMLSRIKAFLEIEILKSKPKFLGEKIEIK